MAHRKALELESKEEKKPEAKPLDRDWTISLFAHGPGLLNHVHDYCTEDNASTLAASSHQFYAIPQYRRDYEAAAKRLLQLTANPSQENIEIAEAMIKQNYRLILQPMPFTEELCGQREWKTPISSLEYTAWAGDTPLRKIYLKCLPTECLSEALRQLVQVQEKGTEHGKPLLVIYRLIDSYKRYRDHFNEWTWEMRDHHWIHDIGKNQLNSVVNLIQWYCSRFPFDHTPNFNQVPDRACLLEDGSLLSLAVGSLLGASFSLYTGKQRKAIMSFNAVTGEAGLLWGRESGLDDDLAAISRFCEVRTQDLIKDISLLQQLLLKQDHLEQAEEKSRCLVM